MDEELCVERSPGQWIAYKILTANSGVLSILGSGVRIHLCLPITRYLLTLLVNTSITLTFTPYCLLLCFLKAIILMISRGRAGLARLQNRLLVCMSFFDILGSLAYAASTAPIPRGSSCAYGAIGNKASCTAQGILLQLGLIVPCYNAILCVYYLAVIKYNVSDEVLAKYEPLMHFTSIAPSVIIIIIASLKDYFNNYAM